MAKVTNLAKNLTTEFYPKIEGQPGALRFRYPNGKLDEDVYNSADEYKDGFARVKQKEDGAYCYRDLIGQLSDGKSKSGKQLLEFFNGKTNVDSLTLCDFTNPKLESFIIMVLNLRHADEFNSAKNDNHKLEIALRNYNADINHALLKEHTEKNKSVEQATV